MGNLNLKGKTAIITGASKGIGKAIAVGYRRERLDGFSGFFMASF